MLSALDQCTKNNRPRKGCGENVRTVEGRDMSANEACYFYEDARSVVLVGRRERVMAADLAGRWLRVS